MVTIKWMVGEGKETRESDQCEKNVVKTEKSKMHHRMSVRYVRDALVVHNMQYNIVQDGYIVYHYACTTRHDSAVP